MLIACVPRLALGRFLTRLFSSLDYPTDHKLIAVGGCEAPVVSQLSTILEQQPDIRVFHSIEFLGASTQPMTRPVCATRDCPPSQRLLSTKPACTA